jgi:spore maturation protein CgeB
MMARIPKSVLLAGPCSDDSFAENVAYSLSAMGVTVIRDASLTQHRYTSRWRRAITEANRRLRRNYTPPQDRWLIRAAKANHPEVFLAPTQVISEEALWELKKAGVRARVAWWGDPPANMQRIGLLSDEWDFIFLKDPDAVCKFRRVCLNAHLLHEAMNPAWHCPLAQQENDCIVVAGNFYEYRQLMVRRLLAEGIDVQLYGGRLPQWVHREIRIQHTGRYIIREEKSRIFGAGLACLNSTQVAEGNSLNCRAFEIAGAGGLHLMEFRPIISECFEPGTEVLIFDSIEELLAHIERARRFPKEMQRIRDAAAKRALTEHTYRHRLERIFKMVGEL